MFTPITRDRPQTTFVVRDDLIPNANVYEVAGAFNLPLRLLTHGTVYVLPGRAVVTIVDGHVDEVWGPSRMPVGAVVLGIIRRWATANGLEWLP